MNEEGTPFKNVFDKNFVATKVIIIPKIIIRLSMTADISEEKTPDFNPIKNIVKIEISAGNLPLQGTKLLVKIAISRSRGESIILHPTTPAALHPNPIHIVRACFPQALHLLKGASRL